MKMDKNDNSLHVRKPQNILLFISAESLDSPEMNKQIKTDDKQRSVLDVVPLEIVVDHVLPFMDEMTVYCLHMTCRRFRGVYRHLRPWDDRLVDLPYPLWSFVRLKWCPICDQPYNGKQIDKYYGHSTCHRGYGYEKQTPPNRIGTPGLYVVGPDFNFCLVNAAVTREMYFGAYPDDDLLRYHKLTSALSSLEYAERHSAIMSLDNKIQLAPGVKVDYTKLYVQRGGRNIHDVENDEVWLWGLGDARRTAIRMWDWWKKTVRPKFVWEDSNEWHKTMEQITCSDVANRLLQNLDSFDRDGNSKYECESADLKQYQDNILRLLPRYINKKLVEYVVDTCTADLGSVMCQCVLCMVLKRRMAELLERQLTRDNVAMGISIRGLGDVLRFGDLVHKSPEIHRQFTTEVSKSFISSFRILKLISSKHNERPDRATCAAIINIAYKYVLGGHSVEAFEQEMNRALDKYELYRVVEAFQNGGPGNILTTAREFST